MLSRRASKVTAMFGRIRRIGRKDDEDYKTN
jgi:hypothetical protein